MTNRERAENLVQKYQGQYSLRAAVEEIAAQLDEAVKEALSEAAKLVEAQKMTGDDLYALPDHKVRATVNAMLGAVVTLLRDKAGEAGK